MTDKMRQNKIAIYRVWACMVLMLAATLGVSAQGNVTLKLKNEPLPKALRLIEQQGGKSIIFSVSETEKHKVSANIRDTTQAEAINRVLTGKPFVSKEREEYFVVQKDETKNTATGISGKVVDENQEPMPYCNVLLLNADSAFIEGCVTKEDGSFMMKGELGNAYLLKVSYIGYATVVQQAEVQKPNHIQLSPHTQALRGIAVDANRKPFIIKDDRIVFNPSFVAYATNANDIIRQAPGVMDTGTSLVMPGKDAIRVYINGKEQKGSLNDVLLLLKSYPATDVEAVEVMFNPSTRYTMGRNVGVINIKLKKNPSDYFGGNAAYSFAYDTKASNESSAGMFYQGKRLFTSLNAAGNLLKYDIAERNTVGFADYTRLSQTNMTRNADDIVLRWNMNYQLADNWDAGASAYYAKGRMKQEAIHRYNYSYNDGRNEQESVDGKRTDNSDVYFAAIDLNGKLSPISNLTFNVDYYHKSSPTERILHTSVDESLKLYTLDDIESDNVTARVNYNIAPNSKLSLNIGTDGIVTNSKNTEKGMFEDGTTDNGKFKYNETEVDLYGEARYKFNPQWMLRGSLRYQSIWTEAETQDAVADSKHFDIICPSAYLSYLHKEKQSFQLGFYYNINKPTLTALNPAELYMGNNTYRKGNPELKHSRHYVINLTYSVGSLMVQPYVEWLDNGITEISILQDDKYHMMTWENAVDRRNIGLMTFYSYSHQKWMRASMTAFLSNAVTTSCHPLLQPRISSLKFSIHPNLQFYFDNEKRWILSVFGYYTTPEHTVDMKLDALWKLSTSLTWKLDKEWTISATGQNLLYSHTRGVQYIGNSAMTFDNQYIYSGVQLSVSYAWGKSMRRSMDRAVLRDMNTRTELD